MTASSATPASSASAGAANAGKLAPEEIQRVVRAGFSGFKPCYDDALKKDPHARGRTSTRIIIDRTGHVSLSSDLGSTGTLPAEMGPCVASHFEQLEFPPPEGGNVTVVYPLVFGGSPDDQSGGIALGSSSSAAFDKEAAAKAMNDAAKKAGSCAKPSGPKGAGHIKVTFDASGHVTATELDAGPFAGTSVGVCITAYFHEAHIPAFSGTTVTVGKSLSIP
ncbi:MAG TPA: AgmX/PglI C-terminal domain-containing protein [Polyangiaceae bacterium]|nr:AgmX/PglI C-terminal domain-containing protein [Polyangiaceae bacterium]